MPCLIDNIQSHDEKLQHLVSVIESATSFQALVLVSWQIAKRVAVLLIEEILARRGQQQTHWSNCPMYGHKLHSKGLAKRQITILVGVRVDVPIVVGLVWLLLLILSCNWPSTNEVGCRYKDSLACWLFSCHLKPPPSCLRK